MTDGRPLLTQVKLDSVDITEYVVNWRIERKLNETITTSKITLNKNILNIFTFDESTVSYDVEIYRGVLSATEKRVFKGETLRIEKDGVNVILTCADELNKLKRKIIVKSWDKDIDPEAGNISEIWNSVITTYGGLTAQYSATTKVLTKWVSNHKDAFTNAQELTNILDWQMYYDDELNKVILEPKGTLSQTSTLTIGENVMNRPVWKYDITGMVNKVKIIGAEQEVTETESFNGDGSTDTFTLQWTPANIRVIVGGVEQVGGNEASSGTYDYTIDTQNKNIIFEAGSIPASGTGNIVVEYSHMLPRPVILQDNTSITNNGLFESVEFRTDLKDIDDAKEYGRSVLKRYSTPFVESKLKVIDVDDIQPGQTVLVIDTVNNINTTLLINDTNMNYPYYYDEVTVGDKVLRTQTWGEGTDQRIARLEQEMAQNQDLLLHVFDFTIEKTFVPRYLKLQKKSIGSSFILGHPTNGILGTSELGDQSTPLANAKIVQGNNTYDEYLYDTVFIDSANTTATINTTTNEVEF